MHTSLQDSTKSFTFHKPGAMPDDDAARRRTCMTAWRGVKGSRYWEGLFGAVSLPGGKGLVHFYHKQSRVYTQHPGAEPGEEEPTSLFEVSELPCTYRSSRVCACVRVCVRAFVCVVCVRGRVRACTSGVSFDVRGRARGRSGGRGAAC